MYLVGIALMSVILKVIGDACTYYEMLLRRPSTNSYVGRSYYKYKPNVLSMRLSSTPLRYCVNYFIINTL